ncbi:MAG: lysophospholipase [Parvibaculaceae bacterium]|nr:lysophospholipase [Parvibaculaceae bacterium]
MNAPLLIQNATKGGAVVMSDGIHLPLHKWGGNDADFVILGVHGFNDYAKAFSGFGSWLKPRNGLLYAYDQRGFGEAPHIGQWSSGAAMGQDLSEVAQLLKQKYPNVPLYIVGLSMGGAVVLSAMADDLLPHVDGLIVAAPAVWGIEEMNVLYRSSLWLAAHTFPTQTLTGAGLEIWPSDNIEMLIEQGRDPLVIKGTRIDTIYGLSQLMQEAQEGAGKVDQPLLWLYGAKDAVVPPAPTAKALARAKQMPTFVYYPEGYHMLLRDLQREEVYEDIFEWVTTQKMTSPNRVQAEHVSSGAWTEKHIGNTPVKRAALQQRTKQ